MTDPSRYPGSTDDADRESTGTPWEAYVIGTIVVVVVLLFIVLHLTGTVGPGGH